MFAPSALPGFRDAPRRQANRHRYGIIAGKHAKSSSSTQVRVLGSPAPAGGADSPREFRVALFRPLLPGASLRDRLLACAGGVLGIALTSIVSHVLLPSLAPLPLLVAPMGASAVLVFAVPASPLAQPWSVIGGNTISALVGVASARLVPDPSLAAGLAVGGAILAMSLLRCLHPPGGAAALTAVIGGPVIHAAGFSFALLPVGVNAVLLTIAGLLFHRLSGHSYPHRPSIVRSSPAPTAAHRILPQDLELALDDLGDSLDVSVADLTLLLEQAESHAAARQHASRDR
jgi:CBS domain-containing membrane protein